MDGSDESVATGAFTIRDSTVLREGRQHARTFFSIKLTKRRRKVLSASDKFSKGPNEARVVSCATLLSSSKSKALPVPRTDAPGDAL